MTEGQIKFQTLVENQRHNLQMERLGAQEIEVSKRQTKIKEAEEYRNAALFPQQKLLMNAQSQERLSSAWLNAGKLVETGIKAVRGFFGIFNDAAQFAGNVSGSAGGGYYQGSLFA